jgi:hypothetical protein
MKHKIYYLASPFSSKDRNIEIERTNKAIEYSIKLLNMGIFVFSPIAYNGSWVELGIRGDWEFWKSFDETFIERMDGLIVLALDGWEESVGVQAEIEHARKLGLSVIIVHPEQINNKDENFLNLIDYAQEI